MNKEEMNRLVPEHMHKGLVLWVEHGIRPGGFMTAVLENNLREAMGRADSINRERLFDIVSFLYNEAPGLCWGSPEKVAAWENRFRSKDSLLPGETL